LKENIVTEHTINDHFFNNIFADIKYTQINIEDDVINISPLFLSYEENNRKTQIEYSKIIFYKLELDKNYNLCKCQCDNPNKYTILHFGKPIYSNEYFSNQEINKLMNI